MKAVFRHLALDLTVRRDLSQVVRQRSRSAGPVGRPVSTGDRLETQAVSVERDIFSRMGRLHGSHTPPGTSVRSALHGGGTTLSTPNLPTPALSGSILGKGGIIDRIKGFLGGGGSDEIPSHTAGKVYIQGIEIQRTGSGVQAAAGGGGLQAPTFAFEQHQAQSSGQPLHGTPRFAMESYFGTSFSGVQVHADASAGRAAADINADAFTVGQDVYFGRGMFQPNSPAGMALLGHELTHVVQQGSAIQRKPKSSLAPRTAGPGFRESVGRSTGQTLPSGVRGRLESYFGQELGDVRVHTDAAADEAARSVGAQAFAMGQDIFFRSGHYDPTSPKGLGLIGHEVAHTIQQQKSGPSFMGKMVVAQDDVYERAADAAAREIEAAGPGEGDVKLLFDVDYEANESLGFEEFEKLERIEARTKELVSEMLTGREGHYTIEFRGHLPLGKRSVEEAARNWAIGIVDELGRVYGPEDSAPSGVVQLSPASPAAQDTEYEVILVNVPMAGDRVTHSELYVTDPDNPGTYVKLDFSPSSDQTEGRRIAQEVVSMLAWPVRGKGNYEPGHYRPSSQITQVIKTSAAVNRRFLELARTENQSSQWDWYRAYTNNCQDHTQKMLEILDRVLTSA